VLRIPIMRRLFYAQIVSTFGDFLALFAIINFLTFQLHAVPEQVTGLQIAYLLPIAVLGIIAGVFVDRWPLKVTLVASDFSRAVLCLLLLFAGRGTGRWGAHGLAEFYGIMAAISVFSSFFSPAQGVVIRSAVPLHGLRSSQALMQQVLFGMRIVGPAIAGVLYKYLGARVCYMGDSLSFLASGTLIASLAISRAMSIAPSPAGTAAEAATKLDAAVTQETAPAPASKIGTASGGGLASILPDMKQGLGFIAGHRGVLFVTAALAAAMFIIGCFGPLIAIYVRDTVHASTGVYAWASGLIGAGMFVGVNLLNTKGKHIANTVLVFSGLLGIALGLVFLAGLHSIWSTLLADFIIGVSVSGVVVPANVLVQQETPPALLGRVGSTTMSLIFSAQIVGLVLSGQLADRIGVRHVFAWCAVLLVVLVFAGRMLVGAAGATGPGSPAAIPQTA
jgi:DHA3 family macrolide efflux protein-like MFS transporter